MLVTLYGIVTDAEDFLGEITVGKAETGDNERYLAAGTHAGADPQRPDYGETAEKRRYHAAENFGHNRENGIYETEIDDRL